MQVNSITGQPKWIGNSNVPTLRLSELRKKNALVFPEIDGVALLCNKNVVVSVGGDTQVFRTESYGNNRRKLICSGCQKGALKLYYRSQAWGCKLCAKVMHWFSELLVYRQLQDQTDYELEQLRAKRQRAGFTNWKNLFSRTRPKGREVKGALKREEALATIAIMGALVKDLGKQLPTGNRSKGL